MQQEFTYTFLYAVGCNEFDYISFNVNHSAFSQAPGTQITLVCDVYTMIGNVIITCESDGRWEPDPESSLLCTIGIIIIA